MRHLIVAPAEEVVGMGREILERERERWLEWVVEALARKFPGQGSRVIMEMLGLVELKQTRFYQEVYQEGEIQGRQAGEAKGRQEGEMQGRRVGEVALVLRQLQRKVGNLSPGQIKQIQSLSLEQLESLGEALLDFTTPGALDHWLEYLG